MKFTVIFKEFKGRTESMVLTVSKLDLADIESKLFTIWCAGNFESQLETITLYKACDSKDHNFLKHTFKFNETPFQGYWNQSAIDQEDFERHGS